MGFCNWTVFALALALTTIMSVWFLTFWHQPFVPIRNVGGLVAKLSNSNPSPVMLKTDPKKKKKKSLMAHSWLPSQVASTVGEPPLKTANVDETTLWRNPYNVVHVIHTRFLQHSKQHLEHLDQARLDLFQTFCLPSILQQQNQEESSFLWLIWTDAKVLETVVGREFLKSLSKFPKQNVLVLATSNPLDPNIAGTTTLRSWYGYSESTLLQAVVAGDPQWLHDYHHSSLTHLLIHTNLDADDALAQDFVESVQVQASLAMGRSNDKSFTSSSLVEVYCPEAHTEYRYYKPHHPHPSNDDNDDDNEFPGHLVQFHNHDFCISSGLTQVYQVVTNMEQDVALHRRRLDLPDGRNCNQRERVRCNDRSRELDSVFYQGRVSAQLAMPLEDNQDRVSAGGLRRNVETSSSRSCWLCPDFKPIPRATHADTHFGLEPPCSSNDQDCYHQYEPSCPAGSHVCRPVPVVNGLMSNALVDGTTFESSSSLILQCEPADCWARQVEQRQNIFHPPSRRTEETVSDEGSGANLERMLPLLGMVSSSTPEYVEIVAHLLDPTTIHLKVLADSDPYSAFRLQRVEAYFDGCDGFATDFVNDIHNCPAGVSEYTFVGPPECARCTLEAVYVCLAQDVHVPDDEGQEEAICNRQLRLLPMGDDNEESHGMGTDGPNSSSRTLITQPLRSSVLMAKTFTAAGMKNVLPGNKGGGKHSIPLPTYGSNSNHNNENDQHHYRAQQQVGWDHLADNFGVNQTQVAELRRRFEANAEPILTEALAGQCSPGHSCKESSKRALGALLEAEHRRQYK